MREGGRERERGKNAGREEEGRGEGSAKEARPRLTQERPGSRHGCLGYRLRLLRGIYIAGGVVIGSANSLHLV